MTINTQKLRDLLARATERPWIVCKDPDDRGSREVATVGWFAEYAVQLAVATPGVPGGDYQNTAFGDPSTDAELTAEAVNSLPTLLDQIEAQAAEIEALKHDIAEYVRIASEQATEIKRLQEALTELCDEIDKHEIHAAISKTSISWFKRKARATLAQGQGGSDAT